MKRLFFVFLIFAGISNTNFSQEKAMAWDSKFALAGGFTPGWIMPNFDGFNNQIKTLGLDEFSNSGFFATGGAGHVSLPFLRNFRVGGMGIGGSTKVSKEINGRNYEAKYSSGFGGFTAEYTFPFVSKVAISAGVILGGGNRTLELYNNNNEFSWDEIWQNIPDVDQQEKNIYKKLTNSFFSVTPTLHLDIPYKRFFAFRIGAGYQIAVNENWKADNGQKISNVPSNLNNNSFFIQTGIFIGFFNY